MNISRNKYEIIANMIALLCLVCICIKFTSAHFTYALIFWGLLVGISVYHFGKWTVLKSLKQKIASRFLMGLFLFYGCLLLSSILLWDDMSFWMSWDLLWMTASFFMFYTIGRWYNIHYGFQWGLFWGSICLALKGLYQWYLAPGTRIQSFLWHPNGFGEVIGLLLPFLLYYAYKNKNSIVKFVFVTVILILLFDLYHTESRGAMMGLGIGIAGSAIFGLSMYWRTISAKWRLEIAAMAICAFALGAGMVDRVSSERDAWGASGGERLLMLEASYHMWDDHKWLGVGLANWETAYYSDAYHPKEGREQGLDMPHNMPIYFFSTTGILGGLGYCFFLLVSFWTILKKSRDDRSKALSMAMMAMFLAFTAQSMVDMTIINKYSARIYFALWGYYLARTAASSLGSDKGHSLST